MFALFTMTALIISEIPEPVNDSPKEMALKSSPRQATNNRTAVGLPS
jgi:hypothetical protein